MYGKSLISVNILECLNCLSVSFALIHCSCTPPHETHNLLVWHLDSTNSIKFSFIHFTISTWGGSAAEALSNQATSFNLFKILVNVLLQNGSLRVKLSTRQYCSSSLTTSSFCIFSHLMGVVHLALAIQIRCDEHIQTNRRVSLSSSDSSSISRTYVVSRRLLQVLLLILKLSLSRLFLFLHILCKLDVQSLIVNMIAKLLYKPLLVSGWSCQKLFGCRLMLLIFFILALELLVLFSDGDASIDEVNRCCFIVEVTSIVRRWGL